jgi:hypothetical protein
VYYCRWRGIKLRLSGRDERFVWGQFVPSDGESNESRPFRFDLESRELKIGAGDNLELIQLDELGVEVRPDDKLSTKPIAGDEPQ